MTTTHHLRHDRALRGRLVANLEPVVDQPPRPGPDPPSTWTREAAVAILLHPDEDGRSQFFVVGRASHLSAHAGQFGLPGGGLDPGEGPATAARRELHEELAVSVPADGVVGRLDPYVTRSGYRIHPIVLWSDVRERAVPDPNEVAAVYLAHLDEIDDAVTSDRVGSSLPMMGTVIHAPTGEILRRLVVVGLHGQLPGPGLSEPRFTWR